MEAWVLKLKDAYQAGYYKTEVDSAQQTPFPWQNKSCKDCPFWLHGVCRVYGQQRPALSHTCSYFDAGNRAEGQRIIDNRVREVRRAWWEQFGR
ncbi:MAG: hypothetical protein ACRDFX_04260 [Chloroflexota bacterium]